MVTAASLDHLQHQNILPGCVPWEALSPMAIVCRHRQLFASMAGTKLDYFDWNICTGGGICYYLMLSPRHCRYLAADLGCDIMSCRVTKCMCTNSGDAPRWLYYFNAFSVFWYLHLDCLDGKQARRTKSSSPLGQLFDHGTPFKLERADKSCNPSCMCSPFTWH